MALKVAVMGAGLSGLACAIELERNGITPTILEKRSEVGDRFVNAEALLSIFSRPIRDEIEYLSETHNIYLKPTANISKLVLFSPNRQGVLEGRLGFANIRGRHEMSFEKQLQQQLESPVQCNADSTYEQLVQEYTHVLVATGDPSYASDIIGFDVDLQVTMQGATVEGEFSRRTVYCWFDPCFAPKGYGYLIPYSETEANIAIAFPEHPPVPVSEQERMWALFQTRVQKDIHQSLRITDTFHIHGYPIGLVKQPRVGNTLFIGNNYGSVMPFFGFGQFAAILTGIYAARDICGVSNYEESLRHIEHSYRASLVLRRAFEKLDGDGFDFLVSKVSGELGHWLMNTDQDVLKWASYLLRLLPGVDG